MLFMTMIGRFCRSESYQNQKSSSDATGSYLEVFLKGQDLVLPFVQVLHIVLILWYYCYSYSYRHCGGSAKNRFVAYSFTRVDIHCLDQQNLAHTDSIFITFLSWPTGYINTPCAGVYTSCLMLKRVYVCHRPGYEYYLHVASFCLLQDSDWPASLSFQLPRIPGSNRNQNCWATCNRLALLCKWQVLLFGS